MKSQKTKMPTKQHFFSVLKKVTRPVKSSSPAPAKRGTSKARSGKSSAKRTR